MYLGLVKSLALIEEGESDIVNSGVHDVQFSPASVSVTSLDLSLLEMLPAT